MAERCEAINYLVKQTYNVQDQFVLVHRLPIPRYVLLWPTLAVEFVLGPFC